MSPDELAHLSAVGLTAMIRTRMVTCHRQRSVSVPGERRSVLHW